MNSKCRPQALSSEFPAYADCSAGEANRNPGDRKRTGWQRPLTPAVTCDHRLQHFPGAYRSASRKVVKVARQIFDAVANEVD